MKRNGKLRKLVILALLVAFALITYVIEAQIPAPVPIPGVKLGLANVFSLMALLLYGYKEGFIVLFVRILLGSLFTGQMISFIYSLSGGILCMLVMIAACKVLGNKNNWAISALGAIGHNIGQISMAALILQSTAIFYYLPVLILSGIVTGIFTGLCVQASFKALKKALEKSDLK